VTGLNVVLYDYPTSICSQMARLALLEKGVPFERRNIDIMKKAEQFEPWYMELNPKAVVPTLAIGDEIITDTVCIVYRIDRDLDGPRLMPVEPECAEAMGRMMRDIMGLHYGVLMYSRLLDEDGKSPVVVARGHFLREQRSKYPDRASCLMPGSLATRDCKPLSPIPLKSRAIWTKPDCWSAGSTTLFPKRSS
jgi:glutathione S-transferase